MLNFTIKQPCVIDISHWNIIDWNNVLSDIAGFYIKVSEGKDYQDPDAKNNFEGAGRRGFRRGLYHFFQINDVAAQVANFIDACTKIGAIVDGKWVAEMEPVLDAEYIPRLQTDIVGSRLAAQYKTWLDMVEEATGVRPIVYSSAACLNYACDPIFWTSWKNSTGETVWGWLTSSASKAPAWAGTYKLWTAGYPDNPDSYSEPYQMPIGWPDWFVWQYKVIVGGIQGISSKTDLNVFNGTIEEWRKIYPMDSTTIPPSEEIRYKITASADVYIRDYAGATKGKIIGMFKAGQVGYGTQTMGTQGGAYYSLLVESGADIVGWVYARFNSSNTYATIVKETVPTTPPPVEPPPTSPDQTYTVVLTDDATGEKFVGKLIKSQP